MIVCRYKKTVSKDNKPFEDRGTKEFRTHNELEAHRIIKKWNDRGQLKNKINIIYRYDFISVRHATREQFDTMRLYTESDC